MFKTFQKSISKTALLSLAASLLMVIGPSSSVANATHPALNATNAAASDGIENRSLFVATQISTVAVSHPATAVATTGHAARSTGLTAKSTATSAASQTATVRAGGVLSLYAQVSTVVALTADGGSFTVGSTQESITTANTSDATGKLYTPAVTGTATPIAALWTSPTTAGTYTISLRATDPSASSGAVITAATGSSGGLLAASIVVTVEAIAHDAAGTGSNYPLLLTSAVNDHLLVAVQNSTTGAAIISSATDVVSSHVTPRSLGLLVKDSTVGTAQTATVLAGGRLSLYAHTATDVAFTASGGSFSGGVANRTSAAYSNDVKSVFIDVSSGANLSSGAATSVAVGWTAPSTAGTYTVSMFSSASTNQLSETDFSGTLTGQITVTVVASSAGGSYSAAYSLCNTRSASAGHGVATGVDTTSAYTNGQTAYIAFDLDDAYDASLDPGNIVVTATGGGLVELAANGSTAAAGTASTKVAYAAPTDYVAQVIQGTANAPMTSTVTITYNGTTVCTKTISIRGEIAKLVVGNIATGDINSTNSITAGASTWMAGQLGVTDRAGLFTVVAQDSAGNTVVTNSGGSFAVDSATITTTVQALSVTNTATSISTSTDTFAGYAFGTWTCGAAAGSSSMKLKWTNSSTGTVITSDAFTARCADDPYTYTASWDKASYVAGEIATLTVQFLDSKGNKANNVGAPGSLTVIAPMLTAVSSTSSATNLPTKSDGTRTYTFTVGKSSGITTGTYVSIVEYASLVAGTKQTPSYKINSGTDDIEFSEVLKSVVALIASINKQIQALQKLILQRNKR